MARAGGRRGFTLVEVLVVLAILVLLFALLFAPMIVGLDMVTDGRVRTNMQDALRGAMEQVRRDLSDAVHVYPMPTMRLAGEDGTLGNADDEPVTDFSQIVILKAARDENSQLITPIRPSVDSDGDMEAVRYVVKLVDPEETWSSDNPFALYRQQGYYRWDAATEQYEFGGKGGAAFEAENILTPRTGADIPPTSTICRTCGTAAVGYVTSCPGDCSKDTQDLVYLHSGIRFVPERIEGETLTASEHNTLYTAKHGAWFGYVSDPDISSEGAIALPDAGLDLLASQLQPRIIAYRMYKYDEPGRSFSRTARDSYASDSRLYDSDETPSFMRLRWNPHTGIVRVGEYESVKIAVHADDAETPPVRGAGSVCRLTITDDQGTTTDATDDKVDEYDASGDRSGGSRLTSIEPIWGNRPPSGWQDPIMPVGFIIHPQDADGSDAASAAVPAKVVPNGVHVRITMTLNDADSTVRRAEYTLTDVIDQEQIGRYQFAQYQSPDDRQCEVRFNRWEPPSPDQSTAGSLAGYEIEILYYYRRNFDSEADSNSNIDDIIVVDYSTAELINVTLTLNQFVDPEPLEEDGDILVVPSDMRVSKVVMHDQVQVRNVR